jgi:hypothetical protein
LQSKSEESCTIFISEKRLFSDPEFSAEIGGESISEWRIDRLLAKSDINHIKLL